MSSTAFKNVSGTSYPRRKSVMPDPRRRSAKSALRKNTRDVHVEIAPDLAQNGRRIAWIRGTVRAFSRGALVYVRLWTVRGTDEFRLVTGEVA